MTYLVHFKNSAGTVKRCLAKQNKDGGFSLVQDISNRPIQNVFEAIEIKNGLLLDGEVNALIERNGYRKIYRVTGNTYPVKDKIKKMGFKFNGYWETDSITKEMIEGINSLGLNVELILK